MHMQSNMTNTTRTDGEFKPDLNPWVFGLCATYLFILGFISLFFNSSIFYLYYRVKALRTDFNLLLMNLLFGEWIVAVYGIPVDFWASAKFGWDMGSKMCKATGFLLTFLGIASIYNLTAIALFRYLVMEWSNVNTNFMKHSRKIAVLLAALSWVSSFTVSSPPLFGWGRFAIEESGMSCAPSWKSKDDFSYNMFLFTVGFFLPLFILMITGIKIVNIIRKHFEHLNMSGLNNENKENKVTEMIFIMVSVYLFCWGPYALQSLLSIFGLAERVPLLLSVIALQFAKSSILWNPVIYVLLNKSFHKAFLSQLADPLKAYISKKLNVEDKSLSETVIGRRQHPKMFGKFKSFWEGKSKSSQKSEFEAEDGGRKEETKNLDKV